MANKNISELTAATEMTNADLLVIEQNGVAKKMTGEVLLDMIDSHGGISNADYTAPVSPSLQGTLTLTFSDGDTYDVPIMNGAAGADGTDGADGAHIFTSSTAPLIVIGTNTTRFYKSQLSPNVDPQIGDFIFYETNYYQVQSVQSNMVNASEGVSFKGDTGDSGSNGLNGYVHIKWASQMPTSNSDMGDIPDAWMGICSDNISVAPGQYTSYKWYNIKGADGAAGATGADGEDGTQTYLSGSAPTSSGGYNYFPATALTAPIPGGTPKDGDLVFYRNSYYRATGILDQSLGVQCGQAYELIVTTASDQQVQDAVDAYLDEHTTITGTFTNSAKTALISLLEKVAYTVDNGQDYLNALEAELFAVSVDHITAVFTQGDNVIYSSDSLNYLKQFLVVTAVYEDTTTGVVPSESYTLSGTLSVGTSTITVTYQGKTATFNVVVSNGVPSGYKIIEYVQRPDNATDARAFNGLGFMPNGTDDLVIKIGFMVTKAPSGAYGYYISCRSQSNANTIGFGLNVNNSLTEFAAFDGTLCSISPNDGSSVIGRKYDLVATKTSAGMTLTDGTHSNTVTSTPRPMVTNLFVFGAIAYNADEALFPGFGRIYYLNVKEANLDKINLIPSVRISDNAVGFYDTVQSAFRTSAYYVAGPDR